MPKQQPVIELEQFVFGDEDFQTLIAAILVNLMDYQPPSHNTNLKTTRNEPGDQ